MKMREFGLGATASTLLALTAPAAATPFLDTTPGDATFTASATGVYDILAFGAQGGDGVFFQGSASGGLGAEIGGYFNLTAGETLSIVVGGEGAGGETSSEILVYGGAAEEERSSPPEPPPCSSRAGAEAQAVERSPADRGEMRQSPQQAFPASATLRGSEGAPGPAAAPGATLVRAMM